MIKLTLVLVILSSGPTNTQERGRNGSRTTLANSYTCVSVQSTASRWRWGARAPRSSMCWSRALITAGPRRPDPTAGARPQRPNPTIVFWSAIMMSNVLRYSDKALMRVWVYFTKIVWVQKWYFNGSDVWGRNSWMCGDWTMCTFKLYFGKTHTKFCAMLADGRDIDSTSSVICFAPQVIQILFFLKFLARQCPHVFHSFFSFRDLISSCLE